MVKCPKCGKEMEEGLMISRFTGMGNGGFTSVSTFLCKSEGLFKVKDKVSMNSTLNQRGFKSFICKQDQLVLTEFN